MEEKFFLEALEILCDKEGFVPLDDEKPWLAPAGPNNFVRLHQDGSFEKQPAKLELVVGEQLSQGERDQVEARRLYAKKSAEWGKPIILLPRVLHADKLSFGLGGSAGELTYRIFERPAGKPIFDVELFNRDLMPDEARLALNKLTEIWWSTEEFLKNFAVIKISKTAPKYFFERFQRWDRQRVQEGGGRYIGLSELTKDRVVGAVFRWNQLNSLAMSLFWNLFGATDINKTADGKCYLSGVRFEPKPLGFGPAAWIWSAVLYSWQRDSLKLFDDVRDWIERFAQHDKTRTDFLTKAIAVNLVERLYAAAEVDLPLSRSPYDCLGLSEARQCMGNIRFLLNELVKTLV